AKQIIMEMFDENLLDTQGITEQIKQSVRVEEITHIGPDRLPAGPNVLDSDAILVVEGRADVLNLLRFGIKNAVAVGGTNVPPTIAELCAKKVVTAFTDGDRGGELIVKELLQVADIDYVARAPEGKCVEDMTQKEIVRALRQKIPVEQVLDFYKIKPLSKKQRREATTRRKSLIRERPVRISRGGDRTGEAAPTIHVHEPVEEEEFEPEPEPIVEQEPEVAKDVGQWFVPHLDALSGTLSARLFDRNQNLVREVAVRDLAKELKESNGDVAGVIFDGVVTQRILDIAADKNLEYLIGAKLGNIVKSPLCVKVMTGEA
ncbi:MAG TPA: DNA primase DnaG, partial [Methanothrix sp.]|nr:DNA primase DnaG [Methanothrix sp.]